MRFKKKNYDLRIVFGLSLLLSLLVFAFERDFGVNLFTEIGGVALTVFVINKIIERRERQKRISIDQRILREMQFIIASYFSIWKHLVWQTIPSEKVLSPEDLIRIYPALVQQTNIQEEFKIVSLHHPESWELFFYHKTIKECFENYRITLTKEIQTFINDYKIYIEPELLDLLLGTLECQYFKDLIIMNQEGTATILQEIDQDPGRLDSYLKTDDTTHIHQFIKLINYSTRLRDVINEYSDVNVELYQLKKYFIHPSLQYPEQKQFQ